LDIRVVVFSITDLERVADTVIDDIGSVELRKLVAPRAVTRWDSALGGCGRWVSQGNLFGFPCAIDCLPHLKAGDKFFIMLY